MAAEHSAAAEIIPFPDTTDGARHAGHDGHESHDQRGRFGERGALRRHLSIIRPRSSRLPQASSWYSEAVVAVLVAALLGMFYLSFSWYGFDVLEEGYFMTNARRVQLGGLPYRDFDTPYTPGIFYLYAWLMSWLGQDIVPFRMLLAGARLITGLALYGAARRLMPPFFAALTPLLLLLLDTSPEMWAIHPGWLSTAGVAVAVLVFASYLATGRSRWLLLAGIAAGVAFAFKQNLAAYGLMIALWFLVAFERHLPLVHARGFLRRWQMAPFRSVEYGAGDARILEGAVTSYAETPTATNPKASLSASTSMPLDSPIISPPAAPPPLHSVERGWPGWTARAGSDGRACGPDEAKGGEVVARSHLPSPAWQRSAAQHVHSWWLIVLGWLQLAVQGVALILLPLTAAAITRPYLSPFVAFLFIVPLAVLSAIAALDLLRRPHPWLQTVRVDGGEAAHLAPALSFYARPAILLAGFAAVTLPWLGPLIYTFRDELALLGPLIGQIDQTGYFYPMRPMGQEHLLVFTAAVFLPAGIAAAGKLRLWNHTGAALALAAAVAWLGWQYYILATTANPALPPHLLRPFYDWWQPIAAVWSDYGMYEHPLDDLVLHLPVVAFWTGLTLFLWRRPFQHGLIAPAALLRLWYLAAGAALFLNQYPRMDSIHLLWSGGVLFIAGADLLHVFYRNLIRVAPAIGGSTTGRLALRAVLLTLPVVALVPHFWWRQESFKVLVPSALTLGAVVAEAAPEAGHQGIKPALIRWDLPGGPGRVWIPPDQAAVVGEIVTFLQERTAPGEPIFTYPAIPGFYYLADRPNATRFNHVFPGMASPAEQQRMVQQLESVRHIIWDDAGAHFWVQPGDNAPVTEYIRTHFRIERFVGPYAILTRDYPDGLELPYFLPG